ncbi:hypothetical protein CR532_04630 (plasmid) [Candidatus Borreliella tachyglossi]|uniref:Uncharacterized protein n=1 Tax=Candidatus Borreliella tachyglossi TaxID=1964448 RepID=A0A2S1LYC7_9SPIR|nr:DUF764 family protein [Candidatus Borreliella tachyglossi]AWG43286.1 hypothetical protein CR532_04630 [Candidatus Borreliella tachyglossi]
MLLSLYESQTFLIKVLLKFKEYLKRQSLNIELINSYNSLNLSDLPENHSDLLVVRPEGYEELVPRSLRSGGFYGNVNEFSLNFTIYFLGFTRDCCCELATYCNLHSVYEHFLEFLHESSHRFEFLQQLENSSKLSINYYIKAISNLNNEGIKNVSGGRNRSCIGLSQIYRANIQAVEI